ncbi:MAG: hypothetical protein KKA41_15640, partial [Proteobacteria bacterium]|nr:hypothetical protein [Pseudomonadota bacterium]
GFHTFGRNNLVVLPGQVMWISNPDLLYKVFLPLLMFVVGIAAILKKDKKNYFYLSVFAMIIDAINRLSLLISHYYVYLTFDQPSVMEASPDSIIVKTNYLPSHIMLGVEVVLIFIVFKYIYNLRNLRLSSGS